MIKMIQTPAVAVCALGAALAPAVVATAPAAAAIVCKDGFQKSGGTWISTPYCNDADLARIARKHGVRISDSELRNDPSRKYEICRFLGTGRTGTYCPDDNGSGRGR